MSNEDQGVAALRAADAAFDGRVGDESFPWEPQYGFCEYNTSSNVVLAKALEAVRRRVCAYGGGRCDCKYGRDASQQQRAGSEMTGCPELAEVIHRLLHRPATIVASGSDELSDALRRARAWKNLYHAAAKSRDELSAELEGFLTVMPGTQYDALLKALDEPGQEDAAQPPTSEASPQ